MKPRIRTDAKNPQVVASSRVSTYFTCLVRPEGRLLDQKSSVRKRHFIETDGWQKDDAQEKEWQKDDWQKDEKRDRKQRATTELTADITQINADEGAPICVHLCSSAVDQFV